MKRIQGPADLAINGAPPAFPETIHVGCPNLGSREMFLRLTEDMLERRWLSNNGPHVQELEQRLADYLGVRECVTVCNGTIGLEIAIRALGLSGEVVVPSYTFIATAHILRWLGITPIFADIDAETHCLDPLAVRQAITDRTTGILGVHLWGRAAPVEELQALAEEFRLQLLFDAAHAFGCSHKGQMIGRFGNAEVLSFHATKFFNTFEGGAITTNDRGLAEKMRLMRNFGFAGLDRVVEQGTNGKMTEVCAAMGLANLASIDDFVAANRRNYHAYRDALAGEERLRLFRYEESEKNNFQYVVLELAESVRGRRDFVVDVLTAENVLARKYFWPGCHRMQPYADLESSTWVRLAQTESVADRVIVLPTGTQVSSDDAQIIARIIRIALDLEDALNH